MFCKLETLTDDGVKFCMLQVKKKRVLNLDMSKAYDQVEWYFLEAILLRLRFSRR